MTATTEQAAPAIPRRRGSSYGPVLDVVITLAWFAVAGLLGALIWSQVVDLPRATRVGDAASLSPVELTKQVGIDAWFFVIALVAALVSAIVLLLWRRRDPLLMVVLVVVGGGLAAWLMVHLGRSLGPGDEVAALRKVADGGSAPTQLKLYAPGVELVWPIAAALGALVYLWVLRPNDPAPAHRSGRDASAKASSSQPSATSTEAAPPGY